MELDGATISFPLLPLVKTPHGHNSHATSSRIRKGSAVSWLEAGFTQSCSYWMRRGGGANWSAGTSPWGVTSRSTEDTGAKRSDPARTCLGLGEGSCRTAERP